MFWSRPGAEILVVFVVSVDMHAGRDSILTTQRFFDIKISMVGIHKVKVRLRYLSLAHVSHFFSHTLQSVHLR